MGPLFDNFGEKLKQAGSERAQKRMRDIREIPYFLFCKNRKSGEFPLECNTDEKESGDDKVNDVVARVECYNGCERKGRNVSRVQSIMYLRSGSLTSFRH